MFAVGDVQVQVVQCLGYQIKQPDPVRRGVPGGLAISSDGQTLYVANVWAHMFDPDGGAMNLLLAGAGGIIGIPAEVLQDYLRTTQKPLEAASDDFVDVIALHELGHVLLIHYGIDPGCHWLNEFVASYFACAFVAERHPFALEAALEAIATGEIAKATNAVAATRVTMDFMAFPRVMIELDHQIVIGEGPPLVAAAHPTGKA